MISVVIPVHNEEKNIEPLYKEIIKVFEDLKEPFEIIYINDGSTDRTEEILKTLKAKDDRVRVLNMDRNRGEAAALTAGFFYARGEIVISMDGDGQNDPSYIPELLHKLKEGYTVVSGWRQKRKEPLFTRKIPSIVANRIIGLVTGIKVHDNGCSLKAYRAYVVKRIQIPHGFHRFIPAIFGVKNSEVAEVKIIDRPRRFGRTHYGIKRIFEVLRELLTIPWILGDRKKNEKKLNYITTFSFLAFFISVVLTFWKNINFIYPLIFLVFGTISFITLKNLKRFHKAQEEGVFKVEEL